MFSETLQQISSLISTSTPATNIDFFKMFYTVLGGLGIFLYGMNIFSQVLQSMGSNVIKKFINYVAANRIAAAFVGVIVTTFVQSSSVSTVMMSSFVNSGLMTLTQGIGFIFGANIGTTITGWIISLNIGKYGLLLIGIGGLPLLFSSKPKVKLIGRLIFCLGLIFFGLELMGNAFRPLRSCEEFKAMMLWFNVSTPWGILACMGIGCLMTMIVQSSSAMLGITIALASTGNIEFGTAAALVLGENIGTTITLWLASLSGGRLTKQTALAHTTFNICGCTIAFLIFPIYLKFINQIVPGNPYAIPTEAFCQATQSEWKTFGSVVAQHIAMTHTLFNVGATLLFLPFLQYLVKFVNWAIPDHKEKPSIEGNMEYFTHLNNVSPVLAVEQAQLVVDKMVELTEKTLHTTQTFLVSPELQEQLAEEIAKAENKADKIQEEVLVFTHRISQFELTSALSQQIQLLIHTSDELESITDYCLNIVRHKERFSTNGITLRPETLEQLNTFMNHVIAFFRQIHSQISQGQKIDHTELWKHYRTLTQEDDQIKNNHLAMIRQELYPPRFALTLSEITTALRRICSHTLNIAESHQDD